MHFQQHDNTPVVDSSVNKNFLQLLNANSYQKGGWVLHMLRRKLGDTIFWAGIRNYYATYAGKNASTDDFRNVMEAASGQDLQLFFREWLFTPEQPRLHTSWKYNEKKKTLSITVEQQQDYLFSFPLQLLIESVYGKEIKTMDIKDKTTVFSFSLPAPPSGVTIDPNTDLLFEDVPGGKQ